MDGITRRPKSITSMSRLSLAMDKQSSLLSRSQWPTAVAVIFVAILINSVTLISAFEAHVVNVTATIERRPSQCDALSPGYWSNNEGCSRGEGESIWVSQINTLSATFSGVFTSYTSAGICAAEWQPNCGSVATHAGRLCRAKRQVLANELDVVSEHLDLDALLAGADRGGGAFNRLGLSAISTVGEALATFERVIAEHETDDTIAGREWLVDVSQVAERLYTFYEDENPVAPQCVYNLGQEEISLTETDGLVERLGEISATGATTTDATSIPIIVEANVTTTTATADVVIEETTTIATTTEVITEEATTTEPVIDEVVDSLSVEGLEETSGGVTEEVTDEVIDEADSGVGQETEAVEEIEAVEVSEETEPVEEIQVEVSSPAGPETESTPSEIIPEEVVE